MLNKSKSNPRTVALGLAISCLQY